MTTKRSVLLFAVAGLTALWLAPKDAMAQAEKIHFEAVVDHVDTEDGEMWISEDNVLHIRGELHENLFFSDQEGIQELVNGDHAQVTNVNVDLNTGQGTVSAKWTVNSYPLRCPRR
jgi:hypothetical protein